jgi:queuine/archaeosine tRNA-ribosyltransferase
VRTVGNSGNDYRWAQRCESNDDNDQKKMANKLRQLGTDPDYLRYATRSVRLLNLEESIGTQTQTKPEPLENYLELLKIALEHVWALDSLPDAIRILLTDCRSLRRRQRG